MSESPSLRARLHKEIDPRARNIEGLSNFNKLVVLLVLCATLVAILRTEPSLQAEYADDFFWIEIVAGVVFLVEFALRLWAAPEEEGEGSATSKRLRFLISPLTLLDLVIITSIFLPLFFESSAFLRMLRVFRILALARLTRFSRSLHMITQAVYERRYDLVITLGLAAFLMLSGATALYWIEGPEQPEVFGSIPRALWWAVITLTTVGYGDVTPITLEGKMVAGLVAFAGIALVALPTGILAAAFSDGMQRQREMMLDIADETAPDKP
ncbi:ion transporter [Erythrobacter sp. W53]|uniref:ion transporter n=1 Tax=Erythrobacter sp. W53 TaxID=3425947 RepID=UPI003D76798D